MKNVMKSVLTIVGFMITLVCMGGVTYTSFNNKTGAWENASTWNGSKPANASISSDDIINVYGYVTRNGSYTINGNATLHIYDTLVITGNLTMSQLSTSTGIRVHNGGLLIVLGDFSSNNSGGNMINVESGGRVAVVGNYDQRQGSITTTGAFYTLDTTPTFNWGATVDGTGYSGNSATLAALVDDANDLYNNDKPLAAFLESLNGTKVVCNATPNYVTKNGAGSWATANDWVSNTKPPYTLSLGAYTIPANHIVTIESGNFTLSAANLIVYGTLIVNGTLKMDAGKNIDIKIGGQVTCCSGCNASNKIIIGGNTAWTGSTGTVNGPAIINSTGVLPIKLSYFNGMFSEGKVKLSWATSTEENFEKFEIERSSDGFIFEKMGEVKGAGFNTYQQNDYSFADQSPVIGKNYYRLKNLDLNGTFDYSKIIRVDVNTSRSIILYPNPVVGQSLTVKINFEPMSFDRIQIVDNLGMVIKGLEVTSLENTIQLPENLPSGVYMLRYISDKEESVFRFLVRK